MPDESFQHIPQVPISFPNKIFWPRQLELFTKTPDPIPIGIYLEPKEGEELIIEEGLDGCQKR